jgi:hypothetical protein
MRFVRSSVARFAIPPVFGLLTGTVVAAAEVLFYREDASLLSMMLFFVIPMGGVLLGLLCSSGVYLGLWLTSQGPRFGHYFFSLVLSLGCITMAYYYIYKGTFVDDTLAINYEGRGKPLSEFVMKDTNEPVDFPDFLQLLAESQESDVVIRVGRGPAIKVAQGVRIPRELAELQFVLSWFGVAAGGLVPIIGLSVEIRAGIVPVT